MLKAVGPCLRPLDKYFLAEKIKLRKNCRPIVLGPMALVPSARALYIGATGPYAKGKIHLMWGQYTENSQYSWENSQEI